MTTEVAAQAMALTALPYWGVATVAPRVVKFRENIVFEADLRDLGRVALRLHRPGYQSRTAIEAELMWTRQLAAQGLRVPEPLQTRGGAWTVRVGERVASLVRWLPGAPLGAAEVPLAGTVAEQRGLMSRLGVLIAELHDATDRLAIGRDLQRPVWDAEGFLGPQPLWGPFWANPVFTEAERGVIAAAREAAWGMLPAREVADFGLIHADVLRENVLDDGGQLALIDFDDSGWGYRLYDLATAVVQSLEEPGLDHLVEGLLAGYAGRRQLADADVGLLPLFVMLRTFASAGWIASRAAADDPRQRFYAERALRMARHVLTGTAPWN